jgi:hypothetical protein
MAPPPRPIPTGTIRGRWSVQDQEAGPSNYSSRHKEKLEDTEDRDEDHEEKELEERDEGDLADDDFKYEPIPPPSSPNMGRRPLRRYWWRQLRWLVIIAIEDKPVL